MSAKHTPGPWVVGVDEKGDAGVFADDYGLICYPQEDNYQANAALIAEAPAMQAEIQETELNLVQMLLAVNIGKKTKQQQIDFMRGVVERIIDRNRALLARLDGTEVGK